MTNLKHKQRNFLSINITNQNFLYLNSNLLTLIKYVLNNIIK